MSMYLRTRYFPPRGSKFKIQSTYSYPQYPQNSAAPLPSSRVDAPDRGPGFRVRAGGAVTALPKRCFCAALLLEDDGLVLCASGHVYALAPAIPADVLEALDREGASG